MVEHNIWFWLLTMVAQQVSGAVIRIPAHQYWGLADSIAGYTVELLTIMLRFLGSFIGLQQLGVMVAVIIMFEITLWIKRLFIDNIFSVVKWLL